MSQKQAGRSSCQTGSAGDAGDVALLHHHGRGRTIPTPGAASSRPGAGHRLPRRTARLAEARAGQRGSTYLYEFGWQPPTFDGRIGACHTAEIPFVFDNLDDPAMLPLLGVDPPQGLADVMHGAWVSFATDGRPGWAEYDPEERITMHFDTVPEIRTDPRARQRSMWDGRR